MTASSSDKLHQYPSNKEEQMQHCFLPSFQDEALQIALGHSSCRNKEGQCLNKKTFYSMVGNV